jgi:Zn-dependent M28 family amino/carboxypeptidase
MKNFMKILFLLLLAGCKTGSVSNTSIGEVDQSTIGKHIECLASDEYLGRMPLTEGETKTVNYLKDEFIKLGLQPGNGDSYFQDVPVVEITGIPSEKMSFSGPDGDFDLNYFTDFVAFTSKTDTEVSLENSELVFAGYGVVAPEYSWNDYQGIDWKGKTALVLVNDPGFGSGDSTLFKGNEMTYYGRWTYKYEEAGRQGAAGVIIIHETEPAAYGWNVVQSTWTGPQLNLESNSPVTDVQAWITNDAAIKLFNASHLEIRNLRKMARKRDFKPVPLGLTTSVKIRNQIKRGITRNVAALIPGTERKDEYIIYTAHWDHFGVGKPVNNDSIYNGAVDNASGTACLLAIAEAFKKEEPPKRSIVFLALTSEEQGLLGSAYYAENPIFPPGKSVAVINMDALKNFGPMKDLTIIGYGYSEMDEYARDAAEKQNRYVMPNPEVEKGYLFRSDHYNFMKIGIPALYASGSYEHFEKGKEIAKIMNDEFRQNIYHQPSDEFDPQTFDLSGIKLDAQLFYEVGLRLANEDYFPKLYEGNEFRTLREDN